jgi:hypothetical protein
MSAARLTLILALAAGCVSRDAPGRDTSRARAVAAPVAPAPNPADSTSQERAAARWVVTPKGIGPVLAGMTMAALDTALGEAMRATYAPGASCAYLRPSALPKDVLVMVQRDTVVRIDVRAKGVLTADSVQVGDTEASVIARYQGRVRTTPHKYAGPTGHDLTVTAPPDTEDAMVFETDGRVVVNYRAGRRGAVALVEGCS